MKKHFTKFLVGFFLALLVCGCFHQEKSFEELTTVEEKVEFQIRHLTIEEKIGQMLISSYRSSEMDDTLKNALLKNQPGGFILFKENFSNYEDTLKLIEEIKSTSKIPMFISIDQEGGIVQRLKGLDGDVVTLIPPMSIVGEKKSPELAYQLGKTMAEELQVFGINVDFAPVLDVLDTADNQVIGNRSFGTDAEMVSLLGNALAKGLKDSGVIPVVKHFPGHGSAVIDSHLDLPVLTKTKEELLTKDLIPFQKAMDEGIDIIMVGHLAIPSITGNQEPASLSKALVTDFLKEELSYDGLVVTDALNMGAITNHYKEKEIYEMAINAGVDLLLMPKNSTKAIEYIKESIEEGVISTESIDRSVLKILTLKYEKLKNNTLPRDMLGNIEHQNLIDAYFK